MSALREKLRQEFLDEEYRYAYDEEFANSRMATQLKVVREQRQLTQAGLAERAGMKQSRISTLENVNYSAWSISTLRRLARALRVRLSFKFESWGEMLPEVEAFSRESLQRLPFEEDPAFQPQPAIEAPVGAGIEKALSPPLTNAAKPLPPLFMEGTERHLESVWNPMTVPPRRPQQAATQIRV